MSAQISLMSAVDELDLSEEQKTELKSKLEPPKKRIRYDVPNYLNFYTLYQYNRDKFRDMLRDWLKTIEGKNRTLETLQAKQEEILEQCFLKDENGNRLRDSDEKHIYRYRTLHKIMREIYHYLKMEYLYGGSIFIVDELNVSYDEETAEIKGTEWGMSIKDRVIIHIRLLRLLRNGFSIKEGLCQIKRK